MYLLKRRCCACKIFYGCNKDGVPRECKLCYDKVGVDSVCNILEEDLDITDSYCDACFVGLMKEIEKRKCKAPNGGV